MGKDYIRFCIKCIWNNPDQGCSVNHYERVYQCPMYRHYHPEEVEEFEEDMGKLLKIEVPDFDDEEDDDEYFN